jgi:hypothetical protein
VKRVAVLVALVATFAPSRALAHGTGGSSGGSSGLSLLLLVGGVALVAGGSVARSKLPDPVAWSAVGVGVVLGMGSFFVPGNSGERPDVHIAIAQPVAGAKVAAGKPVRVRVDVDGDLASGPTDKTGGHLHLSVDGQLQQMPYGATSEVTLEPGMHTLTVEYVDNKHLSYDPPILASVEVEARTGE